VFVVLDEGALRLESLDGYGQLEVRLVRSMTLDDVALFAAIEEEGDELALASQGEQFDAAGVRLGGQAGATIRTRSAGRKRCDLNDCGPWWSSIRQFCVRSSTPELHCHNRP
jgi:hypothetical protein